MGEDGVILTDVKKTLSEKGGAAVYEENPDYLLILKGPGIPSAPLSSGARSAFEIIAEDYPEITSVRGKNSLEGGLIHRIDTDTAGLLLIARTQRFYDDAIAAQKDGAFVKYYTAYCCHGTSCREARPSSAPLLREDSLPYVIESRFRSYGEKGAMVKPVFSGDTGRADVKKAGTVTYATDVLSMGKFRREDFVRVTCSIKAGFRHQVRSHLSSCGYPVLGDTLYGEPSHPASRMLFFASGLSLNAADLDIRLPENILDEIADETI